MKSTSTGTSRSGASRPAPCTPFRCTRLQTAAWAAAPARVCPRGCVRPEDRKPTWDYTHCINCMACIQACPAKAIRFMTVKEPNPDARYRNPHIALKEIIQANRQQ